MDIYGILVMLVAKWPFLAGALAMVGCLVVFAQAIVLLTPSQSDDALIVKIKAIPILGSLISALESFAVIGRKPPQA